MATTAHKIAANSVIQIAGKALSTAIGVAVIAMMTRALGTTGFGYYATTVAFLQIFGILVDMGLTLGHTQFLSEPGADKTRIAGAMLTLRLVTAIVFLGLAPLAAIFFPYPPIIKTAILILSLSFLFISIHQVLLGIFQQALATWRLAAAELIGRAILFVGILWATLTGAGLLPIMWVIVIASGVNLTCTFLFTKGLVHIRPRVDVLLWKRFLSTSWPIGLGIAFNLLYLKGDTIILSLFRPASEVGIYGAPFRVLEILISFAFIFVGLVFPLLRSTWKTDRPRFHHVMQRSFDALWLLTAPMVAGFLVLGTPIMVFVAGADFAPSGPLAQILIVATGLIFFGTLFAHAIIAVGAQRRALRGFALTAVVALVGYVVLIPRFGATGAAWMTVIAEGLVVAYMLILLHRVAPQRYHLAIAGKAIIAAVGMAGLLIAFPAPHVLVSIIVGGTLYSIFILALRAVPKELMHPRLFFRS